MGMLSKDEIVANIEALTVTRLDGWLESGCIRPHGRNGTFSEADFARIRLLCELREDLSLNEEALPIVISLIDQIHGLRDALRQLARSIEQQPPEVRHDIVKEFEKLSQEK